MNHRKGQAALEFLMTYGWAILVVLVAIAALAFFGVLSPDNFLPEKCVLQPGIACIDFSVQETTVDVIVRNSLGSGITVTDVEVDSCTSQNGLTDNVANSATYTINFVGCSLVSGNRYSSALNISYLTENNLAKKNVGEITTKVG